MRILVVEDEHRIANTIKKGMEQERFAVDVVYDGLEGYDMASTEEYDVFVLDRMLPGMDGMEICRELRAQQNHTPILMLTAKSQLHDKVEGLDAGADDYLTKPFCFEELIARVRALSRRPKNTTSPVLHCQDVTLDPTTFQVKRGNEDIALSGKEFALLEYLMRSCNTVLSKDQIIAHVWDYDADVLPNTVEVTIRNIRNKLEKPFPDKAALIQTVRGFGYKMKGE